MEKFIEKLIASKKTAASVKNDYKTLMYTLFGIGNDESVNNSTELADETARVLSTMSPVNKYLLEEIYLHGKPLEQLTEEFRGAIAENPEEFMDEYIEDTVDYLHMLFMDEVEDIFYKMQSNNFSGLKYIDKLPRRVLPEIDGYYDKNAFRSAVSILLDSIGEYDESGKHFEDAYTDKDFEELCDIYKEHMDDIFYEMKDGLFMELKYPSGHPDFYPDTDEKCEKAAFRSAADILRDLLNDLSSTELAVFEKYFLCGGTEEQLAEWFLENTDDYVKALCAGAMRRLRMPVRSRRLKEILDELRSK